MKKKKKKCKAKGCSETFNPINSFHCACSPECAVAINRTKIEKRKVARAKSERKANKRRLDDIQPISYWMKKAQKAFNAYVRERDKDLPCISCGRYHDGQYHAGHYLSVGAKSELRFHPANNNKQCAPCNNHLSGNIINYRPALIGKVGAEMVDYLENFNRAQRLTIANIKEIEAHYKQELRLIK